MVRKAAAGMPACLIILALILVGAVLPGRGQEPAASPPTHASAGGRVWVVDQNNPRASDQGPGTADQPFKTIAPAAEQAEPGDTVLVHAGLYRERIAPARGGEPGRPITYTAAPGQRVVVSGAEVWQPAWAPVPGAPGVFRAPYSAQDWSAAGIPAGMDPYHLALLDAPVKAGQKNVRARPASGARMLPTCGQVFVDGRPLTQVVAPPNLYATPGTWMVNAAGTAIEVHFPPGGHRPEDYRLELAIRPYVFAPIHRGLGFIHVRGFTFEANAAPLPYSQVAAVSTRSGHDWVIAHNTVRYAATYGIECGSEGWNNWIYTLPQEQRLIFARNNVVRDNIVLDSGLTGITGWNHRGAQIIGNIVEGSDRLGLHLAGEDAAIKLLGVTDCLVEGNLLINNNTRGIWFDNGYDNCRITRNLIVNNKTCGVMIELGTKGKPVLIDNNIIVGTRLDTQGNGDGVYCHDASDIIVTHNLIMSNARLGVFMHTITNRRIGQNGPLVETSHIRILDNLILMNGLGEVCLPAPYARSQDVICDYNRYFAAHWPMGVRLDLAFRISAEGPLGGKTQPPHLPADLVELWPLARSRTPLALERWQQLMHQDEHSGVSDPGRQASFCAPTATFQFEADPALLSAPCQPVEGVDTDYFGKPLPAHPLPGPFQDLQAGTNTLNLWPLARAAQAPGAPTRPAQSRPAAPASAPGPQPAPAEKHG